MLWCLWSVYFHEFLFHSAYSQVNVIVFVYCRESQSHGALDYCFCVFAGLCTIILYTISTWAISFSIYPSLLYACGTDFSQSIPFRSQATHNRLGIGFGMLVVLHIHHILAISYQRTFLSFRLFHSLLIIEASYFWLLSVSRNNIFNSYIISFGMYESCTAIHKPFALCLNFALICVLGICLPTLPKNILFALYFV